MKCPICHAEMALAETIGPKCRALQSQWPVAFEETARRFVQLKARFQAGELDVADYKMALYDLMVEHEGTFWTLGAKTDMWYRHDGAQWVQDVPPTLTAEGQPTAVCAPRAVAPREKKRDFPVTLLVGIATTAVLLALGTLAVVLLLTRGSVDKAVAQGKEALTAGDYVQAETCFAQALKRQSDNVAANLGIGKALQGQERYAAAIPYFQEALTADENLAEAHACLAWTYYHIAEYVQAIIHFTHLTTLKPAEAEGYRGQGLSYYALERYQDALNPLKTWANLEPSLVEAHALIGRTAFQLEDYEQASVSLEQALSIEEEAALFMLLGRAYGKLDQSDQAISAYQRSIVLDPEKAAPHLQMGWTYRQLGEDELALDTFEQARELEPENPAAYSGLGYTFRRLQKHSEALVVFQKWARLDPDETKPYQMIGWSFLSLQDYRSAIESFERALELEQDAATYYGLGEAYRRLEGCGSAVVYFQHSLDLDPNYENATNGLDKCQSE